MTNKPFEQEVAEHSLAQIRAQRAQAQAYFVQYQADGDINGAAEMASAIAELDDKAGSVTRLYQREVQSRQPRQAPAGTEAEFLARSPENMTGQDVDRIFSKSKYYTPGQWAEPEVRARIIAGEQEVARRRARGQ
jgi:hypothetical protein